MQIIFAMEPPDQPAIATLLALSDAVAARLYPGAFRQPLNPATLSRPGITLFVARDTKGRALGCAALLDLGDGTAELKRMIVDPDHAGQGVGRHLVAAILQSARQRAIRAVLLEVGIRNVEARRLYERAGFRNRGPFGRYEHTPIATFMECTLAPQPD
ncbi:GNAT family N-acetyltransferase [Rhizobium glycinendophyticum]|uniref:GNAT family N-acetyltransferase n=1 Tax=Rhizobium glycinendophyticum TaxID=2589807 RepID=A0A504UMF6_9HYPH|nr:GNAT family N-acetyltransferase [Rhizobium glycinendophyticum]TPP10276.1 GNAT family N-acetyltransferase [Rhizobium glycinendophyticum]